MPLLTGTCFRTAPHSSSSSQFPARSALSYAIAHRYLLPYCTSFFFFFSVPSSKCFVRLIGFMRLPLHLVHSNFSTIFLVVFAFLWKTGFVWPPKPACLLSYRRLPCAVTEALPVLYWDTLESVCLLHFLQYVRLCFGMFTIWEGSGDAWGCQRA